MTTTFVSLMEGLKDTLGITSSNFILSFGFDIFSLFLLVGILGFIIFLPYIFIKNWR